MTLLVAYASAYGSTHEMARRLTADLQHAGHTVDLCPVEEVQMLASYQAVVIGSPIHCGLWARPMHQFLYRFRHELPVQPLYVWITCMRILEPSGYEHAQKYYVTPELRAVPSVRSIEVFAGRVVPSELSWQEYYDLYHRYDGEHTITYIKGDYREWARFHEWSDSIAEDLISLNITPVPSV